MAFLNAEDDGGECPVCYDSLLGTERTLSCGHVFCHDCLVKTLVSVDSSRDTIVCPVCRHLTFIRKQKDAVVTLHSHKDAEAAAAGQTLEVPVPGQAHRHARAGDTLPRGLNWVPRVARWACERARRHRLVCPAHAASQIFVISAEGRPMVEEDALGAVPVTVAQPNRRRRGVCTAAQCLLFLFAVFTVLALVAATLPWILLA